MLALFVKVPTKDLQFFSRIPNILRITDHFRTSPLVTCVNRLYSKCNLTAETRFVIVNIYRKMTTRGHSKVMYFVSAGLTSKHGTHVRRDPG